ncbi:EmrB/QacA subfamily drug resistance transporter [Methanolinea mesophila]|uniref:MFS transporter n=1 Tax=Methanolinea mesophila TaxID=547055 RepID=UPI001AE6507C|nr:MFS transporter [Methanolinea mesophila]MBP1927580.1 EmrB/QacA subfamily drug resistance transporter [Methanolinea mesophila]
MKVEPGTGSGSLSPGACNRTLIMLMVLIGTAMAVVDGIVVSIALPTITDFFSVGVTGSQWVITGYLVTETSLLLIFGKVSEYTGKRKLFLAGIALFTLSSLACGLSGSLSELILFRVLQATGGAMLFSISAALLFEIFPTGEQGRAMGYVGATIAIASMIAPVLGGFLTDTLGWEYIFLINVPIGAVIFPLALKYMHPGEERKARLKMDWAGAITMILFMVAIILFMGELAGGTGITPAAIGYLILFLVSFGVFFANERRQKDPLLDLSIFRNRLFTLPSIAMILLFIAFFMVNLVGPFYFEGVMGLQPSQVGLVFLIAPIIMIIASPVSGWLYDRYQYRFTAAAGIFLCGISMLLLGYGALTMDLGTIVLTFVPLSIGSALFQSPNNTEIMRALPKEQLGIASSLSATIRNLGMTLGVSLSSILLAYQLLLAGYTGPVTKADPTLLAGSISVIMVIGAAFCFIGTLFSAMRNAGPGEGMPGPRRE